MNITSFGNTVAKLRKKHGYTQSQLASMLNVSNKAVSKWETGGGYPEITLLPALSEILKVSIDYLLKGDTKGITIAGNILVDIVNIIDTFPKPGMLTNITETVHAVGGCVPNTIIDIAKIDSDIFLSAAGKVGDDENGRYAVSRMKNFGIDVSGVRIDRSCVTGCSNVMTDSKTGERTFFLTSGANGAFDIDDIDVNTLDCKIFHIGYILLLDSLDKSDSEYGTRMARLLDAVSKRGIKTSIDVVSEEGDRFAEKVIPALKYCDYVIINEVESSRVSGIPPRNADGSVNVGNIKRTMEKFFEYGVRELVIVHCVEGGFMLNKNGDFYVSGSLKLPSGYIKGSVGAGDAYAAACLYGIYKEFEPGFMLDFAAAAAACNLSASDSISGMKSRSEIEELMTKYEKREIKEQ